MIALLALSKLLPKQKGFTNKSKKLLKEYGNDIVLNIDVYRTPLSSMIETAANLITLGKWNSVKDKVGYDRMFHLALVMTVNHRGTAKKVIVEKNEVVNISTSFSTNSDTETMPVDIGDEGFTLNLMLARTIEKVGDKQFFDYESHTTNCQRFVRDILEANDLYDIDLHDFIFQDMTEIIKETPFYLRLIAKETTDLASKLQRLRGAGDYEVQTVLFPREKYNESRARSWLRRNGYIHNNKLHTTDEYLRFRQTDPSKYSNYYTESLKNGIKIVYGKKI